MNVERAEGYGASGVFGADTSVLTESEASAAMVTLWQAIPIMDNQWADLGAVYNLF